MSGLEPIVLRAGGFLLRPAVESDAADALAMLEDREIRQWMPGPSDLSLEGVRDWCCRSADWSDGTFAMWVVTEASRLVGTGLLHRIDVEDQLTAEVAYRTAPWARRRGVATATVRCLAEFALDSLGAERLELHHAVANTPSCKVAQRAGYAFEGVLAKRYRDEAGRRWDTHIHARFASAGAEPVDGSVGQQPP